MADLRQRIKVDATLKDGVSRGLEGIRRSSDKSLGDKTGLAGHAGKAKLAMAGLATGVVAVGAAILKVTRDVARHNDEIAKMSSRIGASTEALSQYEFVANRSGVEFRTLTMGWQRMTRRISEAAQGMGEARGALKELNLSAAALNKLAPEDQFEAIADAMQGVNGQADKVRLSMKLFDSEGVALVQTMAAGAKGIEELRKKADQMGLTVTAEMARQAEGYEDAVTNLTAAFDGLGQKLAKDVIPLLTQVLEGIAEAMEIRADAPPPPSTPTDRGGPRTPGAQTGGWDIFGGLFADQPGRAPRGGGIGERGLRERERRLQVAAANAPVVATGDFTPTTAPSLLGMGAVDPASLVESAPQLSIAKPLAPLRSISMSRVSSGDIRGGEVAGKGYGLGFQRGLEGTTGQRAGAQGGTILSQLAFGRATDSQAVIDRVSDKSGAQAGTQVLQGWRTRVAKDGDQDIVTPFGEVADSAGELFTENLQTSLTLGLAEFILEGDLKSATKTFGATLAAGMVVDAAAELSEGITKKLGEAFKEGGFAREHLTSAGKDIGSGLKGGANFALESLQVPPSFAEKFGPEGSVGKGVATSLGNALTGAVIGAGIGTLIGDEITQQAATIGGALGGALAGPVGAVIGSITGALASKLPVIGGFIDDIFGVSDKQAVKELGTDVQAFGGITGFFERIGGFEGIRGTRAKTIAKAGVKGDAYKALVDTIRVSLGTTGDQAKDVVDILQGVAERRKAFERGDMTQEQLEAGGPWAGHGGDPRKGRPATLHSSKAEVLDLLRRLGFTETNIGTINWDSLATPGSTFAPTTPILEIKSEEQDEGEPPPPSGKPAGPGRRRLSVSEGRDARDAGYISIWAEDLGAPIGSSKGNNILNLIDSHGQDHAAREYLAQFYDIVAARGYHGTVNRPTTILAGERGPERVDITPGGAGFMGGASGGGGGTVVHFNVNVQALDPRGVRDLMEGEVGDMLIERIRASSERGETVIYSSGVTTPPSV